MLTMTMLRIVTAACFLYPLPVSAFSRVLFSEPISSNNQFNKQHGIEIENIRKFRAQDTIQFSQACEIGCPGCDVSAGTAGRVMSAPITLYHIYIGHTPSDYQAGVTFRTILDSLATGLQNTPNNPHLNILSGYKDSSGYQATQQFKFGGSYVYVHNSAVITESNIADAIGAAINDANSGIKMDSNAIYTLFFRGDSTYCFDYGGTPNCWASVWCGYHSSIKPTGQTSYVRFSSVGDTTYGSASCWSGLFPPPGEYIDLSPFKIQTKHPLKCIDNITLHSCTFGDASTCKYCTMTSPNNNPIADGAVNVYMHEVFESITDGLNGFYVRDPKSLCNGMEVGDLCALSYTGIDGNSTIGHYNMQLSDGKNGFSRFFVSDIFYHNPPNSMCANGVELSNNGASSSSDGRLDSPARLTAEIALASIVSLLIVAVACVWIIRKLKGNPAPVKQVQLNSAYSTTSAYRETKSTPKLQLSDRAVSNPPSVEGNRPSQSFGVSTLWLHDDDEL